MLDFIESIFIEIYLGNVKYIFGLIYRPPNSHLDSFLEHYKLILDNFKDEKCYLLGDFNIDLLKYKEKNQIKSFVDLPMEFLYLPLINKPTRVANYSSTLIDHVWTNNLNSIQNSGIILNDCSDHFAPFVWFSTPSKFNFPTEKVISFRDWRNLETESFFEYFSNNIGEFMNDLGDDSNINILNFTSLISDSIEKFCPLKYFPKSDNSKKPWLSNDLKILIKEKNKLYKKYLKNPISFEFQYRTTRNQVNNNIKTAKKKY